MRQGSSEDTYNKRKSDSLKLRALEAQISNGPLCCLRPDDHSVEHDQQRSIFYLCFFERRALKSQGELVVQNPPMSALGES